MTELDLVALLSGRWSAPGGHPASKPASRGEPVDGVTVGVVADVSDPKRLGRVKLRLPLISGSVQTAWARIAVPWAGSRRGSHLAPAVGDEALVAFQDGDARYPIVVGFLWSEKQPPPEQPEGSDRHELRSRSGHQVVFDDAPGKERLTLRSHGGHEVILDDATAEITIRAKGGKASLRLNGNTGEITITSTTGDVTLDAGGFVSASGAHVQIAAKGELKLDGRTAVRINC